MQKSPKAMKKETLDLVAERFRLLGDPQRLQLMQTLAQGERSVADLVATSGTTQANVSKHLQLLLRAGLLRRRKDGLHAYYSVADPSISELCDLVCGSLADHLSSQLAAVEVQDPATRRRAARR